MSGPAGVAWREDGRAGMLPCRRRVVTGMAACLLAACGGNGGTEAPAAPDGAREAASQPRLVDVTVEAGLAFRHVNDASPDRLLPETMGAGVAFFDFDGDGDPDLYFVNGAPLRGPRAGSPGGALYRNDAGRFVDVTRGSGLEEPFYGMGVAAGDVDNDGDPDLFVSGVGGDRLYRNRGDGRFEDATAEAGLAGHGGFGSSAAFLDYDRDGLLDLLAGRYVRWTPATDVPCRPDGTARVYCTPEVYPGETNRLFHNVGDGVFEDVTRSAGVLQPDGKTLGVVPVDADGDGWPDLAVANDTTRNFLFLNDRDGTFTEAGVAAGLAYSPSGSARGGMGIDAGTLDVDLHPEIVIGNFGLEMAGLYRGSDDGLFLDEAAQFGIGMPTLMHLAFGTLLADLDADGRLDVVFANGHIEPEIARVRPPQTYEQPLQVFLQRETGFESLVDAPGSALATPLVGRGLAAADFDGDGDLDLAVTQNGREARLFRNDFPAAAWLRVAPLGRRSNRSAYGAAVVARAGERAWARWLVSGRSYLSASEGLVTLGLGEAPRLDRLEIAWPSGRRQRLASPPLRRVLVVPEPETVAGRNPAPRPGH